MQLFPHFMGENAETQRLSNVPTFAKLVSELARLGLWKLSRESAFIARLSSQQIKTFFFQTSCLIHRVL